MDILNEVLIKIKRGEVPYLSYETVLDGPIKTSSVDLADPAIAYISGAEQALLECGEMLAKTQATEDAHSVLRQTGINCLQDKVRGLETQLAYEKKMHLLVHALLEKERAKNKAQLANKPDESKLVKACRCIVEYNPEWEGGTSSAPAPKIRADMYRKMKEALGMYPECPELKCEGRMLNGCCDRCGKGKKKYSKDNALDNICPKCGKHGFQYDARASSDKLEISICLYKNCQHMEKIDA